MGEVIGQHLGLGDLGLSSRERLSRGFQIVSLCLCDGVRADVVDLGDFGRDFRRPGLWMAGQRDHSQVKDCQRLAKTGLGFGVGGNCLFQPGKGLFASVQLGRAAAFGLGLGFVRQRLDFLQGGLPFVRGLADRLGHDGVIGLHRPVAQLFQRGFDTGNLVGKIGIIRIATGFA